MLAAMICRVLFRFFHNEVLFHRSLFYSVGVEDGFNSSPTQHGISCLSVSVEQDFDNKPLELGSNCYLILEPFQKKG